MAGTTAAPQHDNLRACRKIYAACPCSTKSRGSVWAHCRHSPLRSITPDPPRLSCHGRPFPDIGRINSMLLSHSALPTFVATENSSDERTDALRTRLSPGHPFGTPVLRLRLSFKPFFCVAFSQATYPLPDRIRSPCCILESQLYQQIQESRDVSYFHEQDLCNLRRLSVSQKARNLVPISALFQHWWGFFASFFCNWAT